MEYSIPFHQIRKSTYENLIPSRHFHLNTNLFQLFQLYDNECVGTEYS